MPVASCCEERNDFYMPCIWNNVRHLEYSRHLINTCKFCFKNLLSSVSAMALNSSANGTEISLPPNS